MKKVGEGSISKQSHSIPENVKLSELLSSVVPQKKPYFPQISDEVV